MIDDFDDALDAGIAFGLAGYLFDEHARKTNQPTHVHIEQQERHEPDPVNAFREDFSESWEDFVGQEPLKRQLEVHIAAAKKEDRALPHILLASGMPGVGKSMMARLIAKEMGSEIFVLVPPFPVDSFHKAAMSLPDKGILHIDEVHKLADGGKRGAEILLQLLEDNRLYVDGETILLNDITVIGATTDAGKLPETVVDRFPIKPYFQPYTESELSLIIAGFDGLYLGRNGMRVAPSALESHYVYHAIARACQGIPRIARQFIIAARDLQLAQGRPATIEELLEFMQTDPDGMTRAHKAYLVTLYRHFSQPDGNGGVMYIAGEHSLRAMLRETSSGLLGLERLLLERGYVDRSPQGRRLTTKGVTAARRYAEETS